MLEVIARILIPPSPRERGTALGAAMGVQFGVAALRLTRDPVWAALSAGAGAALGAYVGACRDIEALELELAALRASGYYT